MIETTLNKEEKTEEKVIETYEPLPQQAEFHRCPKRYKLYGGSMGGGKTRTLCEDTNSLMIEYPGNRGLLLRKVLTDFKLTTYLTLKEQTLASFIEAGLVTENKSERYFDYWNGSRLYYGGLESNAPNWAKERRKYFSGEYGIVGIDEAREIVEQEFEELSTRLRHRLPSGKHPPFFMLLASNPSQNWLKTRFILNPESDYGFFPALPKDNIYNPPEYEKQLREMFKNDEKLFQAYIEGNWDAIGAINDLLIMADIEPIIQKDSKLPIPAFAERLTVCDPARFGDDTTQIYDFAGARVVDQEFYGKKDTMETVGRLLFHAEKNHSTLIGVDPIAMPGIGDRLREIVSEMERKIAILDIDFREQSSQPDSYLNLRAEVYWTAKRMILDKQCSCPNEPKLHGQLCSIKYKFIGGGKLGTRIKIEDKEAIKKRLGFSPDKADCYVMGLWALQFVHVDKKKSWRDTYKESSESQRTHMSA